MQVRYRGRFPWKGYAACACGSLVSPGRAATCHLSQRAGCFCRAGRAAFGFGSGRVPPCLFGRRLFPRYGRLARPRRLPGSPYAGAHPMGGGSLPHGTSGRPAAQPQWLYGGPRAGLGAVRPRVPVPAPKRAAGRLFPAQAFCATGSRQRLPPAQTGITTITRRTPSGTSTTICWRISTST